MGASTYPVSYRRNAAPARAGSHSSSRVVPFPIGRFRPVAANDNMPAWPKPEKSPARPAYLRGLSKGALRLVPGLGALATAYGVLETVAYWLEAQESINLNGWTEYARCPSPMPPISGLIGRFQSPVSFSTSYADIVNGCTNSQGTSGRWGDPIADSIRSLMYAPHTETAGNGSPRFSPQIAFGRPSTGPTTGPEFVSVPGGAVPLPAYVPTPWVYPGLDPASLPIDTPVPDPRPIPYPALPHRQPNPHRSPTEQSQWGNEVPVLPGTPVRPGVMPFPPAIEVTRPESPGTGQRPNPSENPGTKPNPRPNPEHQPARPPKRTKERKFKLAIAGIPAMVVNVVTEGIDVIDAFYEALLESPEFQTWYDFEVYYRDAPSLYGLTPQEKADLIYRHFDKLDVGEVLTSLAANQLEDMVYGRIGRLVARANQERGAMHGITFGPAL